MVQLEQEQHLLQQLFVVPGTPCIFALLLHLRRIQLRQLFPSYTTPTDELRQRQLDQIVIALKHAYDHHSQQAIPEKIFTIFFRSFSIFYYQSLLRYKFRLCTKSKKSFSVIISTKSYINRKIFSSLKRSYFYVSLEVLIDFLRFLLPTLFKKLKEARMYYYFAQNLRKFYYLYVIQLITLPILDQLYFYNRNHNNSL